ncbi:MAG: FprA family A-type flavoprotein [Candidatus Izimaplasma sp.]|nr:FprA family A-type flavoprotein [Candidatus Izimaplasma bacterium]
MIKKELTNDIYMFSMNLEDLLFESMWELPHGVTMNSYIVKGEKTAIIDGVIGWNGVPETLYEILGEIDISPDDIDYVVINHMEPDHSGWIEDFKQIKDDFTIITTEKGKPLVEAFYGDDLTIKVVQEGDSLALGNGKELTFHPIPNVHWPETMVTYETTSKILFTCDMYGAFGTIDQHIFDDEMTPEETQLYEAESVRYFSNVLTTFSPMVKRAITKTKELDIKMIAPGHGPLYRDNPNKIIEDYTTYTKYASGFGKKEVTILWGSMYGSTKRAVEYAEKILKDAGVKVNLLRLPYATESDIVTNVFRSAGVIIAASTYEYRMFPPVAHAIDELGRKKITNKQALYFGSYGWNPGAERDLNNILDNYRMKWQFVEPVNFAGEATPDKLKEIKQQINLLLENMQEKLL